MCQAYDIHQALGLVFGGRQRPVLGLRSGDGRSAVGDQPGVGGDRVPDLLRGLRPAVRGGLVRRGPRLRFPYSSGIKGSRHRHLRELRIRGRPPVRVFYAFDPYRTHILNIDGVAVGAMIGALQDVSVETSPGDGK